MLLPPRPLLRLVMTAAQQVRRGFWFVTRPKAFGVHAVPMTPAGKVVLVRHTYAKGWRLPGGGVGRGEEPLAAILRELEEEIGLESWTGINRIVDFEHRPDFRRGHGTLFRVDGIAYRPRRSLEIDEIGEYDPAGLPPETTPFTREMIAGALAADFSEVTETIAKTAGKG
ncbi:MAG TPA: NUDIX domain-containing protein [Allosphingosinicella sp.]